MKLDHYMAYAEGRVHKTDHKKQRDDNRCSWLPMQYIRQPAEDGSEL